jgi:hypothetical protein
MFVILLFIAILMRCALDIISPEEKELWAVILYTSSALGLVVAKLIRFGMPMGDAILCLSAIIVTLLNLLWVPTLLAPQIYFTSSVLLPLIVLLILSSLEAEHFQALRRKFALAGTPAILVCLYFFFTQRPLDTDLLTYLNEAPFHTVGQTIAKAALLFTHGSLLPSFVAIGILAVMNVRGPMFGYVMALGVTRAKLLVSWEGAGVVFLLLAALGWLLLSDADAVEAFAYRLIYRDREFLGETLSNFTSGRTEIWGYYFDMLLDSSFLEVLLGRGAVWLYGPFDLMAHNDLLNLLICYGVVGASVIIYAWWRIVARLDPAYKLPCSVLILTLFLTGGIVFHQSNIIFLLYMAGRLSPEAARARLARVPLPSATLAQAGT